MTDTRNQLVAAARALFLEQGFGKTTIQQLADHVGISKGAVYLHFRSKSQVMLAILEQLGEEILEGVREIGERADLSAREKLRAQLRYQFDDVLEHQRLMEVYLNESAMAIDESLLLLTQKLRFEWQQVQEEFLRMAYPDHDSKYTTDLTVMINGALNEYYTFLLLEGVTIDADRVADFLMGMADAMVEKLQEGTIQPVLGAGDLPSRADLEAKLARAAAQRIQGALDAMVDHANSLGNDEGDEIRDTVDLLRQELEQEEPKRIVLQALVANLRDFKALLPYRRDLVDELHLKLI